MPKKPIQLDNKLWRTTEHYFQAQKFIGTPYEEKIRRVEWPRQAFEMSRRPEVAKWKRKDWEEVKRAIMYKALLAKFVQNDHLREQLARTGNAMLVEHSPHDSFWGDGYRKGGKGENLLGKLLMNVRSLLQRHRHNLTGTPVDPPELPYPYLALRHESAKGINQESPDDDDYVDALQDFHSVDGVKLCIKQLESNLPIECNDTIFDDNFITYESLQHECEVMDAN